MRTILLAAAVAASAASAGAVASWSHHDVVGAAFTTLFPRDPRFEITKPMVWRDKAGGTDQYEFIQVLPHPPEGGTLDRISVGSADRYRTKPFLQLFTEAWGEPTYLPPRAKKVGRYTATEAGWRFDYGGRMKIEMAYEIEVAPQRFVYVDLNCYEDSCKPLSAVYPIVRDSLKPLPRR